MTLSLCRFRVNSVESMLLYLPRCLVSELDPEESLKTDPVAQRRNQDALMDTPVWPLWSDYACTNSLVNIAH